MPGFRQLAARRAAAFSAGLQGARRRLPGNTGKFSPWVVSAQLLGMWTIQRTFTIGAGLGYDRRTGEVAP